MGNDYRAATPMLRVKESVGKCIERCVAQKIRAGVTQGFSFCFHLPRSRGHGTFEKELT